MPVVCYTEDRQRIDVVVDPDPVDGTFLVCNLRKAVKEECKLTYANVDAHQIPIALRGSTEPLKGGTPLDSKAQYELLPLHIRQKRSRTVLVMNVMPDGVVLGDQQYKREDVGIILSVGEKDVRSLTLLAVCKSLKNGEEITLHNNEGCVVKTATKEINFSSVNSQPSWEKLNRGSITGTCFSADDIVLAIPQISVALFVWKDSQEGSDENVTACLTHLRTLLKLPDAFDVYRSEPVELHVDAELVLKGTIGDFVVRFKKDSTYTCVTSIIELKKKVSDSDQFQAGAELVGMETRLCRTVPVFLTDLRDDWRLIFRDSLCEIGVMILSRDQAVNMMQQLVDKFVIPVGSSQARFSEPPFPGFLLELPKKRTAGEDRLEDELSVMQMSGCPYNEIRDFIFSRVTFGGVAVDNGEWRNMYA